MSRFPIVACLVLVLTATGTAKGQQMEQQEEGPPVIRLSFFQCHSNQIGDVMSQADSIVIPVWEELVEEGRVMDYGFFTHWWADEWNVGIYTLAPTIDAIISAEAEADSRIQERHPDAPDTMGEACPWHRDGFYNVGPSTGGGN